MNKIKAAIIEDEIPAARLLRDTLLSLRPGWDVQLLPGNIEEAVEWFAQHPHPDILFLDIQLTDGNSFLFIEQAHPESMIVFTTAYDEYAVRAFTVNSIDYLLKPIHEERLLQAIRRFEGLTKKNIHDFNSESRMMEVLQQLSVAQEALSSALDRLCEQLDPDRFFRTNRQTLVCIDAIQRIESYFLGKAIVHVLPPFKDKIIVSKDKMASFRMWLNY